MTKTTIIGRLAFSVAFAFSLAACGGSQPPIGAPGTMVQGRMIEHRANHGGSWMLPEAKNKDLVYAAIQGASGGSVHVFTYPAGKLVGKLYGFTDPLGECVDSAGDVWITNQDYQGTIVEYAHGGMAPIDTLSAGIGYAVGCSVDPGTGNLAVAYDSGAVTIWPNAQGTPEIYEVGSRVSYCGYDSEGNLFVSTFVTGVAPLIELARGSGSFTPVTLDKKIGDAGGQVQWDGKYITLEDRHPKAIYRISVSGYRGKIVGRTTFSALNEFPPTWIQSTIVLAPYSTRLRQTNWIGVWNYPAGGNVLRHFGDLKVGAQRYFTMAVISNAPTR